MHRSEGWETNKRVALPSFDTIAESVSFCGGYEAGADAMLEGLKKARNTITLEFDGGHIIPIRLDNETCKRGWLVFISEGE